MLGGGKKKYNNNMQNKTMAVTKKNVPRWSKILRGLVHSSEQRISQIHRFALSCKIYKSGASWQGKELLRLEREIAKNE